MFLTDTTRVLELTGRKDSTERTEKTFSGRIDELQEINSKLAGENSNLRDELAAEIQIRGVLEAQLHQQREANQRLEKAARECRYFRESSYRFAQGIRKVLPILEDLRDTATFTQDGSF